jgi:MFS family permease
LGGDLFYNFVGYQMTDEIQKEFKYNAVVNIADGTFFGFGLGFSSFSTILPLFVSTMTSSAVMIGLIPAIHNMGWQLPQLFTAHRISRIPQFRPFVLLMSIQERIPFLGLALVALSIPTIGSTAALFATFILLIWQGLGGGITANAWQNMISKVIPSNYRATFFGVQSAGSNLFASVGAIGAGFLLENLKTPTNYMVCFLITAGLMSISYFFLSLTREPSSPAPDIEVSRTDFWRNVKNILEKDVPFRWFVISRMAMQFGMMAQAFYIIYAVRFHHLSLSEAGFMTGVLFMTQVAANPILGWISDKWSRSTVLEGGALAIGAASLLAMIAPNAGWYYVVIILSGIASTAFWIIGIAISLEFGTDIERPTYVGLSNTLISPSTILAPLIGGWLADVSGFSTTFITATVFALLCALMMHLFVRDPQK